MGARNAALKIFSIAADDNRVLATLDDQSDRLLPLAETSLIVWMARQSEGSSRLESPVSMESLPWPDRFEPPIAEPGKILCVGRNYVDHAAETGSDLPTEPLIFSKLPTCLIGHGQEIRLPAASRQIDFEAELVVVIGRPAKNVDESQALEYVAGYMCGNDVTARDWQKGKPGRQWLLGKSFDSFAPVGPCFVTADEIPDPQSLSIELRLNGETMQQANTRDMTYSVACLISYLSQVCTLLPGDLIFTGTPAGVGVARDPQVFLRPGDEVEVKIEGIGCLKNHCVDDVAE